MTTFIPFDTKPLKIPGFIRIFRHGSRSMVFPDNSTRQPNRCDP